MVEPGRLNIARLLQREADYVASLAAQDLVSKWEMDRLLGKASPGAYRDTPGLHGKVSGPTSLDEAVRMMQDGYRRLGSVVALSLMVDEPGLIADDLQWLKRMFGARNMEPGGPVWMETLLDSYVRACESVLSDGEVETVRSVTQKALDLIGEDSGGSARDTPGFEQSGSQHR